MVTRERVGQIDLSNHAYQLRGEARRENHGMKYKAPARRVDLTNDLGAFGPVESKPLRAIVIDRSDRRIHAIRMGREVRNEKSNPQGRPGWSGAIPSKVVYAAKMSGVCKDVARVIHSPLLDWGPDSFQG